MRSPWQDLLLHLEAHLTAMTAAGVCFHVGHSALRVQNERIRLPDSGQQSVADLVGVIPIFRQAGEQGAFLDHHNALLNSPMKIGVIVAPHHDPSSNETPRKKKIAPLYIGCLTSA